jgi:hypothetical protein
MSCYTLKSATNFQQMGAEFDVFLHQKSSTVEKTPMHVLFSSGEGNVLYSEAFSFAQQMVVQE